MSLSTCCQLTSGRRSGILNPSFLSVDPANLCSLPNRMAIHTTRSVVIVHSSCLRLFLLHRAKSILVRRYGVRGRLFRCTFYRVMVIAHSTNRSSLLYFYHPFLKQHTACLTSHRFLRHHLYLLAMMTLMVVRYPTWYLHPPLDPARPPTAVA